MTNSNPYATPTAVVRDSDITPARPAWVWVVFIFYIFSAGMMLVIFFLMFSGTVNIPEEQKQSLANLTIFDQAIMFLTSSANLVAAVLFFRLKKVSAYLFTGFLAFGFLYSIWEISTKGWATVMGSGSGVIGPLLGWALNIGICAYAWHLRKTGVLK